MGPKAKVGPSKGNPTASKAAKAAKGGKAKKKALDKRKSVKKKQSIPAKPAPVITPPIQVVERPRKPGRGLWIGGDFVVMCTFLSYEALHVMYDALHVTSYDFARTSNIGPSPEFGGLLTLIIVIGIVGMSFLSRNKPKYKRLVIGLSIYTIGAICGILLAVMKKHLFAILIGLFQIAWHVVNPLRYYVVFHQRWPIKIKHTRFIVSVNLLFIGLTIWFSVVFVKQKHNSTNLIFWVCLLVAMILWTVPVYLSYSYIMEYPIELKEITEVYKNRPAEKSFDRRNKRLKLFAILLVPIVSFPLVAQLVNVGMFAENYWSARYVYRVDLLITAIVMGSVKFIFHFWTVIRHELEDLFTIFVALVLNAIAISLMLVFILNTSHDEETRFASDRSSVKTTVSLLFCSKYGLVTWIVNGKSMEKTKTGQNRYKFEVDVDGEKKLHIEGQVRGKTIFEDNIVVQPTIWELFDVPDIGTSFVKLQKPTEPIPDDSTVLLFFNLAETCDKVKNGFMYNGYCAEVKVIVQEMDAEKNPTKKNVVFFGQKYGPAVIQKIEAERYQVSLVANNEVVVSALRVSNPKDLQTYALSSHWVNAGFAFIPFTIKKQLPSEMETTMTTPHTKSVISEVSITSASLFYALGIGAARASYLHFLWILCPFKDRLLILAGYCVLTFLSEWVAFFAIRQVTIAEVAITFVAQVLLTVVHFIAMVRFKRSLPPLDKKANTSLREF